MKLHKLFAQNLTPPAPATGTAAAAAIAENNDRNRNTSAHQQVSAERMRAHKRRRLPIARIVRFVFLLAMSVLLHAQLQSAPPVDAHAPAKRHSAELSGEFGGLEERNGMKKSTRYGPWTFMKKKRVSDAQHARDDTGNMNGQQQHATATALILPVSAAALARFAHSAKDDDKEEKRGFWRATINGAGAKHVPLTRILALRAHLNNNNKLMANSGGGGGAIFSNELFERDDEDDDARGGGGGGGGGAELFSVRHQWTTTNYGGGGGGARNKNNPHFYSSANKQHALDNKQHWALDAQPTSAQRQTRRILATPPLSYVSSADAPLIRFGKRNENNDDVDDDNNFVHTQSSGGGVQFSAPSAAAGVAEQFAKRRSIAAAVDGSSAPLIRFGKRNSGSDEDEYAK